jgi:hypothetical protein
MLHTCDVECHVEDEDGGGLLMLDVANINF